MRFWTLFCVLTPVLCVVCKYFLSDFNCFKLIVSIVVQKRFSLIFVIYFCVFFLCFGVLSESSLALQCPEVFLLVVCFRSYIKSLIFSEFILLLMRFGGLIPSPTPHIWGRILLCSQNSFILMVPLLCPPVCRDYRCAPPITADEMIT